MLAGLPGDTDLLLGLPIILYDYPEIAGESPGALFDSTEIDEILTLRVMTMTDAEKAEARATDPLAREIIDRCDDMSPETLQQLHGVLRVTRAALATRRATVRAPATSRGGTRRPTRRSGPTATPSSSTGCRWPGAAWSGSIPTAGPTPRTCSSPTRWRG